MVIERTPVEAPLECYGLELNLAQEMCRACPHQDGCAEVMGSRKGRITLDKLRWKLVPIDFGTEFKILAKDDPDQHRINRVYHECYSIIFRRAAPDNTTRFEKDILKNVKASGCPVRVYLLANMVGWERRNDILAENDPEGRILDFTAARLKGKTALERAVTYRDLCRRSFGTFSPSALETLTGHDIIDNEYEHRMYNSEVLAGSFIINHKLRHAGDGYSQLFQHKEIHLDEIWLAIEPEYMKRVLKWRKDEGVPASIKRHRQGAMLAHGEMKRRRVYMLGAFEARERAMKRALPTVLQHYGYRPVDFEIDAGPVDDALKFWVRLGRVICHAECQKFVEGLPSFYNNL